MEKNGHFQDRNGVMETSWSSTPALRGGGLSLNRYNFLKDLRRLGGDFSVEENQQRLLRFFLFERNVLRALAGWTIGTPEFEVKVELGRHIFWHAEAGMKLRTRLSELRTAEEATDAFDATDIAEFFSEVVYSESSALFVAAMYGVVLPAMKLAYQEHSTHTDQVADAPTVRTIRQILVDYDEMILWGRGAVEAAEISGNFEISGTGFWSFMNSEHKFDMELF